MNKLQPFNNPEFGTIRTLEKDNEAWFVGKDVAEALGYGNPRQALASHVDVNDRDTVQNLDAIGRKKRNDYHQRKWLIQFGTQFKTSECEKI